MAPHLRFLGFELIQSYQFLCMTGNMVPQALHILASEELQWFTWLPHGESYVLGTTSNRREKKIVSTIPIERYLKIEVYLLVSPLHRSCFLPSRWFSFLINPSCLAADRLNNGISY